MSEEQRGGFVSRWGFILAAAGSAVGLGNIWKFPYITGEYGGGAFVLVYLGCIALVGLPLMYAELILGRRSGLSVVGAVAKLTEHTGQSRLLGAVAGGMAVLSGALILSFYSVVAGWAIHYLMVSSGLVAGAETAQQTFDAVAGSPTWSILWHTVFMAMTVVVVSFGVQRGIEGASKVLMPALFVIVGLLFIYVAVATDGLAASLSFLFAPDFSKLSGDAVMEALGHSFFTLSLGMGAMITYGSYMSDERHVVRDGLAVALLDTVLALLAGSVIFAVVFDHGSDAAAGPGLVFVTLPPLFAAMPGGTIVAVAFFFMLIFAAWSSAISLLEVVVSWLVDSFQVSRTPAAAAAGGVIWMLGVLCGAGVGVPGLEMSVFDLFDDVTTKYLLPGGGLLVALIAGWAVQPRDALAGFQSIGAITLGTVWHWTIRLVTPVLVLVVLLNGLGVFDAAP